MEERKRKYKIKREIFGDWYFNDMSSSFLREFALEVINEIISDGKSEKKLDDYFQNCEYIPEDCLKLETGQIIPKEDYMYKGEVYANLCELID